MTYWFSIKMLRTHKGERTDSSINKVEEVRCLPRKEKNVFLTSNPDVSVNSIAIKKTLMSSITLFLIMSVKILLENMNIGIGY